jgi:lipid II:glycine glycyltransferase (peptidoglycan interpeptide bridge formation enzyme)
MTNLLSAQELKKWDARQTKMEASFLQSGLWAKFQDQTGVRPHFLTDETFSCLLLERKTPLGKYLFAPYGPTLKSPDALAKAVEALRDFGRQCGADWLTIEPVSDDGGQALIDKLPGLGARLSDHNREPDLTRIIDLSPDKDTLLATISQSTRSFIRKNEREKFLAFKSAKDPQEIDIFINMLAEVSRRNKVSFFSENYFKTQAALLMPAGMMHLELALADGQPVASAIFHDYGRLSTYTYAGSLPAARATNTSALLLWNGMLNAKARGMQKMDLYGIAPDDAPASHPWAGFTSFKRKFGGEVVRHAGTWDIPITPKYKIYRAAKKTRSLIRRR